MANVIQRLAGGARLRRVVSVSALPLLLFLHSAYGPAVRAQTIAVDGLSAPVEIIRDRWGINHIYARTEYDLFFAQGYAAARDRLFQFEVWRAQATGTVAEMLGADELDRDIGFRLFRFRGDLTQEMNHYHDRGSIIIPAFVDGVNAYIAETEADPGLLPEAFGLLGIRPQRWTPEVVISRHQGLVSNVRDELDYGRAVARIGVDAVKAVANFHPRDPDIGLDSAIDAGLLQDDILRLYVAFRQPVRFERSDLAPAYRADADALKRIQLASGADRSRAINGAAGAPEPNRPRGNVCHPPETLRCGGAIPVGLGGNHFAAILRRPLPGGMSELHPRTEAQVPKGALEVALGWPFQPLFLAVNVDHRKNRTFQKPKAVGPAVAMRRTYMDAIVASLVEYPTHLIFWSVDATIFSPLCSGFAFRHVGVGTSTIPIP